MKGRLLPRVRDVRANEDHTLRIRFSDGRCKIYDVKPLLSFGVFRELKEMSYFKSVRVTNGTVRWPHEQDICPDTLYIEGHPLKEGNLIRRKTGRSTRSH